MDNVLIPGSRKYTRGDYQAIRKDLIKGSVLLKQVPTKLGLAKTIYEVLGSKCMCSQQSLCSILESYKGVLGEQIVNVSNQVCKLKPFNVLCTNSIRVIEAIVKRIENRYRELLQASMQAKSKMRNLFKNTKMLDTNLDFLSEQIPRYKHLDELLETSRVIYNKLFDQMQTYYLARKGIIQDLFLIILHSNLIDLHTLPKYQDLYIFLKKYDQVFSDVRQSELITAHKTSFA